MNDPRPDQKPDYRTWRDIPLTPVCNYSTLYGNPTGAWRTFKPVIDLEKCIGCAICWQDCPDNSIEWRDDQPHIVYSHCKGCGICANECPSDAIEMVLEVQM